MSTTHRYYGPVLAKIRIGKGKFLKPKKFNSLTSAENFHVALSYLNGTDYWDYLSTFSFAHPTHIELERCLYKYYFDELAKISKHSPTKGATILQMLHDCEVVNSIVDMVMSKHYGVDFKAFSNSFSKNSFFEDKLTEESYKDVGLLAGLIKNEQLRLDVSDLILIDTSDPNLISLKLKSLFWKHLLLELKGVSKKPPLSNIIRCQLLKANIMNSIRLRSLGIPKEVVQEHLIYYSTIEANLFDGLLASSDFKAYAESSKQLFSSPINKFLAIMAENSPEKMNVEYSKIIAREAYRVFYAYPLQPAIAYGYMVLKRFEIEDVLHILKAKLLNIDLESIKKVLIAPNVFPDV
ncbi:MAG: V-type ATPase subunit [Nitrososphaeria archaeon]